MIDDFTVIRSSYWIVAIGTKRVPKQKSAIKQHQHISLTNWELTKKQTHFRGFGESLAWSLKKLKSEKTKITLWLKIIHLLLVVQ